MFTIYILKDSNKYFSIAKDLTFEFFLFLKCKMHNTDTTYLTLKKFQLKHESKQVKERVLLYLRQIKCITNKVPLDQTMLFQLFPFGEEDKST